ncbi:MAG: helix-turn-helix domain-containing protein [Planctomycetota bacterium]
MLETISFRPETVSWWMSLCSSADRIRRVHIWKITDHGPTNSVTGLEQHPTDTLVLCLIGAARIENGRDRCDLGAGDAVIIRPGAWHKHAPLRPGSLLYRQGVIAGRSDFFLEDHRLRVVASWPEQPARRLLAELGSVSEEVSRRKKLRELLDHLRNEVVRPLPNLHPASLAMEYALWENLHRRDVVQRVVAASGLARSQAYRVFRQRWGHGISTIIRRERLELASALLAAGLSVTESATRSGILNRSVFARAFRRIRGMAPNNIRHHRAAE